jgi:BirA family transcriptional regulator, biotin operon repressor / biotin---[acetyl-CoA-carboxylase] ligase
MNRYSDLGRPALDARFLNGRLCKPGSLWTSIEVHSSIASTNAEVASRARDGAAEGLVVVAEHQSAGRGRMGRTWKAPPRSALLFSVLLRPATVPAERWPWLGLLVPLAVASAVRRVGELPAVLKWPNDVLAGDLKLAGILLERVDDAAVIGIGLNVSSTRSELLPTATSLAVEGAATTDRVTVLAEVLRELERRYRPWLADPASVRSDYTELSATLGRQVRIELPDGTTVTGTATGLDADGRLLVDGRPFAAGDVIHLRT